MSVSPRALSRASSVCLRAPKYRAEALSSASSTHQKPSRSCLARAPGRSQFGDNWFRELRVALVPRLGSSKSWLRQPCFEAHHKIARKMLMRHLIFILGLTLHMYRCSFTSPTGPFPAHGSSFLVQRERQTVSETELLKKHVSSIQLACLLHCEIGDLGNHLEHVAIRRCNLETIAVKW